MTDWSDSDETFMRQALALAADAREQGEVPVGAVLTVDDMIVAAAANSPIGLHDPSAHAEILALRAGGVALGNYRMPRSTLYVTLEPCAMCAGALVHARVERLVYAAADPRVGACGSVLDLLAEPGLNHRVDVAGGLLAEESSALLKGFFAERR